MSATSSLRGLRALSPLERRILARAIVLLPLAATGLRTLGLRRTQALLIRAARASRPARQMEPAGVARLVDIAARRGLFRAKCLPASLTLQALLAANGAAGELRLGVRKSGARLVAHAWVEHGGIALMEPDGVHARFSAFEGAIGVGSRSSR